MLSPRNSTRTGVSAPSGKTSAMPPRVAYSPGSVTRSVRSYPFSSSQSTSAVSSNCWFRARLRGFWGQSPSGDSPHSGAGRFRLSAEATMTAGPEPSAASWAGRRGESGSNRSRPRGLSPDGDCTQADRSRCRARAVCASSGIRTTVRPSRSASAAASIERAAPTTPDTPVCAPAARRSASAGRASALEKRSRSSCIQSAIAKRKSRIPQASSMAG